MLWERNYPGEKWKGDSLDGNSNQGNKQHYNFFVISIYSESYLDFIANFYYISPKIEKKKNMKSWDKDLPYGDTSILLGVLTFKMSSYPRSPTALRIFLTISWVAVYIYQWLLWELKIEKSIKLEI